MAQIGELRPDRIALYAYAHLPQRFKPQRRILADDLPSASQRVAMLGGAIAGFLARGYSYIGMDHFALPDDALAVAKRQGRLHRNFQGYSTQPDCDLIGLGVSSIGKVGASYYQNAKTLPEYYDALRQGQLPVQRGIALTRDDVLRRAVIMALMCQGRVEFESIELAHLIDMREYFAARTRAAQADGRGRPGGDSNPARSRSPPPAGTWCARWRWSSTARCRTTSSASASRASSDRLRLGAGHQADQRRAAVVAAAFGDLGLVVAQLR